ncbi:MAG TPA: hypothetical protein VMZ53_01420 [Kofleriaceae bacterium]|nr:hypothetical protein [Kofleriaceae bacterium]
MGRWFSLVVAALWLSATTPADACPAGSPCLKYRAQTVTQQPDHFAREGGGTIPKFDRKKLARFLATSKWKPVFGDGNGPAAKTPTRYHVTYVKDSSKLRFVDPSGKIPTAGKDERVILIRQIERDNEGNYFIDVDGIAYQLWYCVSGKRTSPCLTNSASAFSSMFPLDKQDPAQPLLKPMPF